MKIWMIRKGEMLRGILSQLMYLRIEIERIGGIVVMLLKGHKLVVF